MLPLSGKVAVVTGSARGIGRAIALELAARGADVVVAGRSVEERGSAPGTIHATARTVSSLGVRGHPVAVDVGDQAGIDLLVAETLRTFGRVDVLVNNAAVTGRPIYLPMAELTRELFEKVVAVNVTAPFMLTKLFSERMAPGGVVVNLTSGAADLVEVTSAPSGPNDPTVTYGPTKAMLSRLTNAMARELLPRGVLCFALDPGATMTELMARSIESGGRYFDAHPVQWPARIAGWLATSPDAAAFNGHVVRTSRSFLVDHGLPVE
jgi:NAD(P)-dependent dehydrogenase (short-subunit alcohol dehydrogenase family)